MNLTHLQCQLNVEVARKIWLNIYFFSYYPCVLRV